MNGKEKNEKQAQTDQTSQSEPKPDNWSHTALSELAETVWAKLKCSENRF